MQGYFKLCNTVYWLGMMLWLGALMTAGISAMFVFTVLPTLGVHLDQYAAFTVDEPEAHARLAAGSVMEGIFVTVDFVQLTAVFMVIPMLLLQLTVFRQPLRRPANLLRTAMLSIAAVLLLSHMLLIAPRMNQDLRAYWKAAEAGDIAKALEHRAAFEVLHPRAEAVLRSNALLVFGALLASAAALSPQLRQPAGGSLEQPQLLRLKP